MTQYTALDRENKGFLGEADLGETTCTSISLLWKVLTLFNGEPVPSLKGMTLHSARRQDLPLDNKVSIFLLTHGGGDSL